MNKIVLIPPVINPISKGSKESFMPLGLLAIAASLKANSFNPIIYHLKKELIKPGDYKWVANDILSEKPSITGFSTWCITYPASLLVAEQLKIASPNVPVVFGGPQASILPQETLNYFPFIDFVLAGEADYSFPLFLKELKKKHPVLQQIPGLTYRTQTGEIFSNSLRDKINNLDDLPVPAYDMISEKSSIKLDVGRGCPFDCTFCTTNNFFSKKYRVKSVMRILYEMNLAFDSQKIKKFSFAHDMFTLNRKFIAELCSKLTRQKISEGKDFTWTCSARIDCVDGKMLSEMKKAGCEAVFFGIESGSEKIQKNIRKNLKTETAGKVADICRKEGLNVHASFIAGFPDETKKDLEKSLQCAFQLILKGAFVQFSQLSLLPGTPLYNQYFSALKFDALFSNFSNTYCSRDELLLIRKFPLLFSSFYYLPVKTLTHKEMFFLCRIINNLSHFRNTIYLMREILENDLKGKNLLQLFKNQFNKLKTNQIADIFVSSFLIKTLRNYILNNKNRIKEDRLYDVFSFEAFHALLLAQFNHWQFIKNKIDSKNFYGEPVIKFNPVWNILKTSYKLSGIIPSEHEWDISKVKKRKGSYIYLMVAVSNIKCKHYQINESDEFLLKNLTDSTVESFIRTGGSTVSEQYTKRWIKKMKKLGVVKIIDGGKTRIKIE